MRAEPRRLHDGDGVALFRWSALRCIHEIQHGMSVVDYLLEPESESKPAPAPPILTIPLHPSSIHLPAFSRTSGASSPRALAALRTCPSSLARAACSAPSSPATLHIRLNAGVRDTAERAREVRRSVEWVLLSAGRRDRRGLAEGKGR